MYSIYVFTNTLNGKQYVGMTKQDVVERVKHHLWSAKCDHATKWAFHYAIRTHGEEHFIWETVLTGLTYDEACSAEIQLIASLDTYHHGYNSTLGGDGIRKNDEVHQFFHVDGFMFTGTRRDLGSAFDIPLRNINAALIRGHTSVGGWLNPVVDWTDEQIREARERHYGRARVDLAEYHVYHEDGYEYVGTRREIRIMTGLTPTEFSALIVKSVGTKRRGWMLTK